jgi:hypothetical protein
LGSQIDIPGFDNNTLVHYKTLKQLETHRGSLGLFENVETVTPKSMAYYKKIRRPQSVMVAKGTSKYNAIKPKIHGAFESHMQTLTGEKMYPKRITKKKPSIEARPKYHINTVLSNRSGAMNLDKLFSENSLK